MATTLTLLLLMSWRRRLPRRKSQGGGGAPILSTQAPPAERSLTSPPNPRLHSPVCCCLLCEQSGTGEQAMRSVGGDYERFLAQVASPLVPAASQSAASNLPATLRTFPRRAHRTGLPQRGR
jgi:hypothetical protein